MFDKFKEKHRLAQEEREIKLKEEKTKLLSLSEKELLIEILYEMEEISNKLDSINSSIIIHN